MSSKRVRIVLSGGLLLALCLACGSGGFGPPRASVDCQGVVDHYECTVVHTQGGSGDVCWDIRVTCANGVVTSANSCVHLSPGGTVTHNVPVSEFPSFQGCVVSTVEIVDRTGG